MRLLRTLQNLTKRTCDVELADPTAFEVVKLLEQWICSHDYTYNAPKERRHAGMFYPSSFGYDCDRALALNYLQAPEHAEERDPRLQVTFEIGHAVHDRFQKLFAELAKERGWEFNDEVRIKREDNPW